MKYVAYYRVSTKQQGASVLGLEAQERVVIQLANQTGEIIDSYVEIESGGKNSRPELEWALRRCRLTGATLMVSKLDRLSRDIEFIAQLQKTAVKFVCADMPEANTLTIGLLAVLAQHERELISKCTKEALQSAKLRGVKLGNPNLQAVRNNNTSQATLTRQVKAAARRADVNNIISEFESEAGQRLTYQALADKLNDAGYTTPRGKAYTSMQVWLVRNPSSSVTA